MKTTLTEQQVGTLVSLVASIKDDEYDCDGCLSKIAEFADTKLANKPVSEAMQAVQDHLDCCPCCNDEFQALLDGLRAL